MNEELKQRVETYRADFEAVTGKPFRYFFCPILHTDEDVDLCKGHVTNDALGFPDIWVPQVETVDNFFGSFVEAEMVAVIKDRGSDPFDVLLDPDKNRRHAPRIECNGRPIEYYFPRPNQPAVHGHLFGRILDADNNIIKNLAIKMPDSDLAELESKDFSIVIDKDYRPHVIASVIKIAHLTLFKMHGYRHVFSPTGIYLASILRDFYEQCRGKKKREVKDFTATYFLKFSSMCMPIVTVDDPFKGTAVDNMALLLFGASQKPYAMCVIAKAADDSFAVIVPLDDGTIDTYFSFLKEPPVSALSRFVKFVPGDVIKGEHWELYINPEKRIYMPHSGLVPQWAEDKFNWAAQAALAKES